MDRSRIIEHIRRSLAGALGQEPHGLHEGTMLYEDLGLESVGTLELLLNLEDTLEIQVDPDDLAMEDFRTVGSLADYVASQLVTGKTPQ